MLERLDLIAVAAHSAVKKVQWTSSETSYGHFDS